MIYIALLALAGPVLLGRVNEQKALAEIIRVWKEGASLMAFVDGVLVGILGLVQPTWWYGPDTFLTDRWFFVHPDYKNRGVAAALLIEAQAIANASQQEIIINGHMRRRGTGVHFTLPKVISPKGETQH